MVHAALKISELPRPKISSTFNLLAEFNPIFGSELAVVES